MLPIPSAMLHKLQQPGTFVLNFLIIHDIISLVLAAIIVAWLFCCEQEQTRIYTKSSRNNNLLCCVVLKKTIFLSLIVRVLTSCFVLLKIVDHSIRN